MKVIAKKNRELALINAQNTQNENRAETITLVVPEEYEDYNKKIVFITPDGNVWDVITNNEYKITNAITKYKEVDFYIWLTKEVDGQTIDFRTKTKPLNFFYNEDASDEITPEEISGVTTVINLLEEEIDKVENLNIEATKIGDTTTVTITKKDGTTESVEINDGTDGQDGYTPQKGIDYFTEQDIEEIEGDILNEVYTKSETDTLLEGKADVEDIPDVSSFITKDVNNLTNYTLKTNTGSLIDLEINDTTYVVTLKLKNQDGTIISTDTIDLPLESVVVSGRYDNTTKKVILTLENGSEVDFSVADLVAGLQTEITSQNKLASDLVDDTNSGNKFVTTTEKQAWNNKYDKPNSGIPKTDLTSTVQTSLNKADTAIQEHQDISGKEDKTNKVTSIDNTSTDTQYPSAKCVHDSQATQDDEIEALQTENARLKATLPTTGEVTGQDITLDKTAEFEFIKPPLPMGNSEQVQTTQSANLFDENYYNDDSLYTTGTYKYALTRIKGNRTLYVRAVLKDGKTAISGLYVAITTNGDNPNSGTSGYIINNGTNNTRQVDFTGFNDLYFSFYPTNTNLSVIFDTYNIMVSTDNVAYVPFIPNSPSPDYSSPITNVTGDIEVVVGNIKNFLDWNKFSDLSNWEDALSSGYKSFKIENLKPLTTYTFCRIDNSGEGQNIYAGFNSTNNNTNIFISHTDSSKCLKSISAISTEEGVLYVTTTARTEQYFQSFLSCVKDAWVIEGTDYVEHKEQTFTFPLGNEKLMLGDYLADDGIHHVRGQVELNQNNIGVVLAVSTYNSKSLATIQRVQLGMIKNYNVNTALISTYKEETNLSNIASGKFSTTADNTSIWIFDDRFTDLATARNLLLGTIIEFEFEQEVIIPYTSAQQEVYNQIKQALSYEEQTNISSNTIALFNVEAYQSTKLVLEEMATAIVALGGV